MVSLTMIIVLAVIMQVWQVHTKGLLVNHNADAQDCRDKLVDKMFCRAFMFVHPAALDNAVLGKPGHLQFQPSTNVKGLRPMIPPSSNVKSIRYTRSQLVAPCATTNEKDTKAKPKGSVEIMRKFSEQYASRTGTYFCVDKEVTAVVIKGLAQHKEELGAPLCPCRHYDDKQAEAKDGYWNCPCVPMRERHECHCMLFLTKDNDFAGSDQTISAEEIKASVESHE